MTTSRRPTVFYHGTSLEAILAIQESGFRVDLAGTNAGAMLGPGVYVTTTLEKALNYAKRDDPSLRTYGIEPHPAAGGVLKLEVDLGRCYTVRSSSRSECTDWVSWGYDSAWAAEGVIGVLEENCVLDPRRIRITDVILGNTGAAQRLGYEVRSGRLNQSAAAAEATAAAAAKAKAEEEEEAAEALPALQITHCNSHAQGQGTATAVFTGRGAWGTAVGGEALDKDPSSGTVFWKVTVLGKIRGNLIVGVVGDAQPRAKCFHEPTCFAWDAFGSRVWKGGGKSVQGEGGYRSFRQGDVLVFKLEPGRLSLRVKRLGVQTFTLATGDAQGLRPCACSHFHARVRFEGVKASEQY